MRSYIKQVAATIRAREANMRRGNVEQLEHLDRQTDTELVTRWAWRAAIVGLVACFGGGWFALMIFGSLLPPLMFKFFWALVIVGMAATASMFGAALWLTFYPPGED